MDAWITTIISTLGNWGIAVLMFLENVFPPIPSELIMPLAGYTAGRGDLSLTLVIIAGSLGSVLGQFPLYYLGRKLGQDRLHRWADRNGKWLAVSGDDVDRAADWLRRHGPVAVFFCRMIPGIRSFISIPAGAGRMNLWVFTAYSTLGITAWSALLAWLGYSLGSNYEVVQNVVGSIGPWIWGGLIALLLSWIGWRMRGCFLDNDVDCWLHDEDSDSSQPDS
ncbi:DedA family protein [Rubinisphaera brasiliensis]|nr:DedA family protein [Rubinisphaera brasiliensis]